MAMDPSGPWGLRFKMDALYRVTGSYQAAADAVMIAKTVAERFITEPLYMPGIDAIAMMRLWLPITNANNIIKLKPKYTRNWTTQTFQAPYWTDDAIGAIPIPPGTVSFKWHVFGTYTNDHPVSGPDLAYPDNDILEEAHRVSEGDNAKLLEVVFFINE